MEAEKPKAVIGLHFLRKTTRNGLKIAQVHSTEISETYFSFKFLIYWVDFIENRTRRSEGNESVGDPSIKWRRTYSQPSFVLISWPCKLMNWWFNEIDSGHILVVPLQRRNLYRFFFFNAFRNEEQWYRLTSVKTDANSSNFGIIPANSEKLGAEDRSCFFLCPKKSALYEWATTRLYHVFQNYCYSASGLVRPVNTFRNQFNALAGDYTKCGAWTFRPGIHSKT